MLNPNLREGASPAALDNVGDNFPECGVEDHGSVILEVALDVFTETLRIAYRLAGIVAS